MGYRSDVAYVIHFKDNTERDAFVTLMLAKNDKHITEALDECRHDYKDKPIITFAADSVKWYEDYLDVKPHMQLMQMAQELYEAPSRFVRLGEDRDDMEVSDTDDGSYGLWDYVDISRSISTNF